MREEQKPSGRGEKPCGEGQDLGGSDLSMTRVSAGCSSGSELTLVATLVPTLLEAVHQTVAALAGALVALGLVCGLDVEGDVAGTVDGAELGGLGPWRGHRPDATEDHGGEAEATDPDLVHGDREEDEAQTAEGDHEPEGGSPTLRAGLTLAEGRRKSWVFGVERLLHLLEDSLLVFGERHGDLPDGRLLPTTWGAMGDVADGATATPLLGYAGNRRSGSRGLTVNTHGRSRWFPSGPSWSLIWSLSRSSPRPRRPGWPVAPHRCRSARRPGPSPAPRPATPAPARPACPAPGSAPPR